MNKLLEKLSGGDLRADGNANQVADQVIQNPELFDELAEGLYEHDDVIRARTAHALERISRSRPEFLRKLLPQLIKSALNDKVPMVRWHMPMIFANLALTHAETKQVLSTLYELLNDPSDFVKNWSISSLCIMGKRDRNLMIILTKKN